MTPVSGLAGESVAKPAFATSTDVVLIADAKPSITMTDAIPYLSGPFAGGYAGATTMSTYHGVMRSTYETQIMIGNYCGQMKWLADAVGTSSTGCVNVTADYFVSVKFRGADTDGDTNDGALIGVDFELPSAPVTGVPYTFQESDHAGYHNFTAQTWWEMPAPFAQDPALIYDRLSCPPTDPGHSTITVTFTTLDFAQNIVHGTARSEVDCKDAGKEYADLGNIASVDITF